MAEDAKKEKGKEEPKKAEGEATAADGEGASKKKKMIIIGAAVGVLAVGGGVGFVMMSGSKEEQPPAATAEGEHGAAAPAAEGGHGEAAPAAGEGGHGEAAPAAEGGHGEAAPAKKAESKSGDEENPIDFGETYAFKTFHLNLGNPLENHYIRLEVAAEYKGGDKQKEEIEKRLPQLRDAIGGVVSAKSREFLLGPDGKAQLRREILIKMNRYMTTPMESVFITDLLIE